MAHSETDFTLNNYTAQVYDDKLRVIKNGRYIASFDEDATDAIRMVLTKEGRDSGL